jgi:hypothetical protein
MIRSFWASKTEKLINITIVVSSFLATTLVALSRAKFEKSIGESLRNSLIDFQENNVWWLVAILTLIAGTATLVKNQMGSKQVWETVDYVLEQYRKSIFEKRVIGTSNGGPKPEAAFDDRITLFKYVKWRWAFCLFPWSGWMIPIARTGDTAESFKISRFKTPLAKKDASKGIAGVTRLTKKPIPVFNLPEITIGTNDNDIKKYAKETFVDEKWVKARTKGGIFNPRSFLGVPIEVKSKIWGVIVIDSSKPDKISEENVLESLEFKTLNNILGKLLETKKDK